MAIPKNKDYPLDSVQCDSCGGHGCEACNNKGWLTPKNHSGGRRCANPGCNEPLHPTHEAIYCSSQCAADDI